MRDFIKYYFGLGIKTFNALTKVRGGTGGIEQWAVFEKTAGWKLIKDQYRLSVPEREAFQRGWEKAYRKKHPLGKISNSTEAFEKSLKSPNCRVTGGATSPELRKAVRDYFATESHA